MTHASNLHAREYPWDECTIDRYESNNGIVLMHHRQPWLSDVLFFISGEDIGNEPTDSVDEARQRAEPILRTMLQVQNNAVKHSRENGYKAAQADIRKALGV